MNKNKSEYELIVIGGGAAAFAAANTANKLKKKTLLINYEKILPLGGTCVNVGCVPSKVMLYQGAEYYYSVRNKFRAIRVEGDTDFLEAIKETYEMVVDFRKKNYSSIIEKQEYVDFQEGKASFVDANTIDVNGKQFKAKNILIGTGASTFVPSIKGMTDIDYITNVNIFNLKETPKSVIIIGGGPQGMEFSQIFHHFGIKVTVLQRSDRVINKFDTEVSKELEKWIREEGITIFTKTNTKEVRKTNDGVEVVVEIDGKEQTLKADRIMLATGLKPNIELLTIDKARVELTGRGFVKVNKYLQTSMPNIFAAGDVTGLLPLETTAAKQGSTATLNMFEQEKKTINYQEIPSAVFTSPEVAMVGITEDEYMKKYNTCMCSTATLDHVEKALAIKDVRGFIKMVLNHKNKQVIGVQIIGPMAADIITVAIYAIKNKMTIYDIRDTVHVFPTLSEMIKKVAQSFDQNLDEMACCVE